MAYKSRRDRRAKGGKAETEPLHLEEGHQYNAQGSPEEKEEHAKSDGFKRGGRAKKEGGKVEGSAARHHLGRRARGGPAEHESNAEEERQERARGGRAMARGGSPFSAAQKTTPPGNDKKTGPGEQAPMIP